MTGVKPMYIQNGNGKFWNFIKRRARKVGKFVKKIADNPITKEISKEYVKNIAPFVKGAASIAIGATNAEMLEKSGKEMIKNPNMRGVRNAVGGVSQVALNTTGVGKTKLGQDASKRLSEMLAANMQKGNGDMLKEEL